MSAPFWAWAPSSMAIGLGFSFFSGAVEAWLVDALAAMLAGSIAGGMIAQMTNLGMPYVVRAVLLIATFVLALTLMHDLGFKPAGGKHPIREVKEVLASSFAHGLGNPPVRWVLLASPFTMGVSVYAFYAMQPYLMALYGDPHAYGIAGLAAAIVGGAQIAGGLLAPHVGQLFRLRTSALLALWGLAFAAVELVRRAYLNALISSKHRATVLSFDSLLGSGGGVLIQPVLGKTADVWGYPASYLGGAAFQALAISFVWLARRERAASDRIAAT